VRILLAAQNFEGASGWHIARTLRKMQHDVRVFDPGFLLVPPYRNYYTILETGLRQLVRVTNRVPPLRLVILNLTNRRFLREVESFRPDLILAVKAEQIFPRTILQARQLRTAAFNWCFDDPFLWLEQPDELMAAYDHVLLVDRAYVETAQVRVPHARVAYLPQCCDPDIHKTIALTPAERQRFGNDVCFVGSMYPYRAQLLAGLGDLDLGIWGNYWSHADDLALRTSYRGREAYGIEKTKVFNASKIVLNTHHPQAIRATNLRTFEVTGCGGFLLVDRREDLMRLYREGEEFVAFEGKDDLRNKIEYYLSHPDEREKIGRQGQRRAYAEHTYARRLNELLALAKAG
jgi:spore maturation protein CgeB